MVIFNSVIKGGGSKPVNITHGELLEKRDTNQLIPGQVYRITDYLCTTTQVNTESTGHQYDIIVVADDINVLNENACAAHHNGDTYFSDSKLEAWQLKYCIDNDTNRFGWADSTNGKGVVYYLCDEFNNSAWFDFKNIQTYSMEGVWSYLFTLAIYGEDSNEILDASTYMSNSQIGKLTAGNTCVLPIINVICGGFDITDLLRVTIGDQSNAISINLQSSTIINIGAYNSDIIALGENIYVGNNNSSINIIGSNITIGNNNTEIFSKGPNQIVGDDNCQIELLWNGNFIAENSSAITVGNRNTEIMINSGICTVGDNCNRINIGVDNSGFVNNVIVENNCSHFQLITPDTKTLQNVRVLQNMDFSDGDEPRDIIVNEPTNLTWIGLNRDEEIIVYNPVDAVSLHV